VVFNTGPYTVLPENSILVTANMQSETGFPSSHQLKSYVAYKSRLRLAARAVLSADAGLLVDPDPILLLYPVTENTGLPSMRISRLNQKLYLQSISFYSAPHYKRCISYGNSVRPSVCPSHAGIVSKRRHVARCSLHCRIAKCI